MEFKDWVKEQLETNNWTYQGLGLLIGVAHTTVGQWAHGNNLPDPKTLRRLAEVTNTDEIELFKMVGYLSEEAGANGEKKLHPLIEAAVREMEDMSEEGIQLVVDQVRHVLKKRYPKVKK